MSSLEHYFENLLFLGQDCKDEVNKKSLSEDQQRAVEICATYIIYTLFGSREDFIRFTKENLT